ncbi:MAG: M1 family metallopeptidase, partial [Planctomycetota bacterium]|nr:M1 family metallopeptidase [Planctomycetota bacterium]
MRKTTLAFGWALLVVLAQVLPGWLPAEADLPDESPRTIDYDIDARLDSEAHTVEGSATITWRNDSPVPVPDVHLHLYLNAFEGPFSVFMRESGSSHRGHKFNPARPGKVRIHAFETESGEDLAGKQEVLVIDAEGNESWVPMAEAEAQELDKTVVRVTLPEPVPANGGKAVWKIKWTSTLPQVFARTGFGGDFHMVAQWYPKPGVWEQETPDSAWAWNCHQFHGSSEFYSNYGVFRVRLTVPESYRGRVGASGKRQQLGSEDDGARINDDGTITYEHIVEDVHDFAWVAGKDFAVFTETYPGITDENAKAELARVATILGRDPAELELDPVEVIFLLQPEHAKQFERHRNAIWRSLTYMGIWYGKYPYPTLTVVDPDHRGDDAGGMEYPTLITGGTRIIRPKRQLSPEGVLVHEFAHQHFYGLIGSNEFENAWMDEGLTTYATARVLMKTYPPSEIYTWYAGFPTIGERPIAFEGMAKASKQAMPALATLFDEQLKMPFGELSPIRDFASMFGVNHPPNEVSIWAQYEDVEPFNFLREVPPLTRIRPLPRTSKERERGWWASSPVVDPIAGRKAWEYMNRRSYGVNSYGRPSASLRTLEGLVGEETMTRIMRTYAERYRFKHPRPKDFFQTAADVAAKDGKGTLDWFFEDVFQSAKPFDFGIEAIQHVEASKPNTNKGSWHGSIVTVRRFGDVRIPMDVWIGFGEGETIRRYRWELDDSVVPTDDGPRPVLLAPTRESQSRWVKLYFEGPEKVTVAEVDPLDRYGLDRDRTNDGRREPKQGTASWTVSLRALA